MKSRSSWIWLQDAGSTAAVHTIRSIFSISSTKAVHFADASNALSCLDQIWLFTTLFTIRLMHIIGISPSSLMAFNCLHYPCRRAFD